MNNNELDRQIRVRINRGQMTSLQACMMRAVLKVAFPGHIDQIDLDHAQETAKILLSGSPLTPSSVVRNYGAGGLTHDWVNSAMKIAARAAAL